MINKNTIKKAHLVKKIVDEHFEPGRQDRCKMWVYRNVVVKIYPMSIPTFFRLLRIANSDYNNSEEKKQLKLF